MDSPAFRTSALVATASTAVQAFVWIVLSILGIVANLLTWDKCFFGTADSYGYPLILGGTGGTLVVSIWYLMISIIWLVASAVLFLYLLYRQHLGMRILILVWAAITEAVSFSDLIVTILFGIDYHTLKHYYYYNNYDNCIFAAGIFMSIAARLYVLWLINVASAALLAYITYQAAPNGGSQHRSQQGYPAPKHDGADPRWGPPTTALQQPAPPSKQDYPPSYDNLGYQPDGSNSKPPTGQWGRTGY